MLDKEKIDIKVESGIKAKNGDKGVYLKNETNKIIINKKGKEDLIDCLHKNFYHDQKELLLLKIIIMHGLNRIYFTLL